MFYLYKPLALFVSVFLLSSQNQAFAQSPERAPAQIQDFVPHNAPQSQKLRVDREEFLFELRDGVLSVKHFANDAIGFGVGTQDPAPVRSLSLIPNFLVTMMDRKTNKVNLVMLDIVSMTLAEQVHYTLGKDVDAVKIALIPPHGLEIQLPVMIDLRDPKPDFAGVRPASFDKFRKIPLPTKDQKLAIPLLPADSIRSLLFNKGTDVRMYYVDLNDQNQDEDGFFLFRLEGKRLYVSHYGAKKLRFDSFSGSFEESVPPHPFSFSVVSGPEIFHLDPADFSFRKSAIYELPQQYEALEIWSADPNTLSSLFQASPSMVRNSVLGSSSKPVAYRSSRNSRGREPTEEIILSEAQIRAPSRNLFRYVDSTHESGGKRYGEFRFAIEADGQLVVSHHQFETAHFSTTIGAGEIAATKPEFSFRFTIVADGEPKYIELNPANFKDGKAILPLSNDQSKAKQLLVVTNNVNSNHQVFFETLVADLSKPQLSCETVVKN